MFNVLLIVQVKEKKKAIRVRKLKGGSVKFDSETQSVLEEVKEKEEIKKKEEVAVAKDKVRRYTLSHGITI